MVELIIAVIAITVVLIIVATVVSVFTSSDKGEEYSLNGFFSVYTQLNQHEANDNLGDEFDISMHLADEFVIVGFSSNDNKIEGRCTFGDVRRKALGSFEGIWNNRDMLYKEPGALIEVTRPDTCMDKRPCLCLCKQEFAQGRISCERAATCISFDEEHTREMDFSGYEDEDVSCDIPLIYSEQGRSTVSYCARRVSEDSDDGPWVFGPERC